MLCIEMDVKNRAYYRSRIVAEQEAARNAACDAARERHEELAAAYHLRCRLEASPSARSKASDQINYVASAAGWLPVAVARPAAGHKPVLAVLPSFNDGNRNGTRSNMRSTRS